MTKTTLTSASEVYLTGKKIIYVGKDYIQLDDGRNIYLDEDEIESINDYTD